MKAAIESMLEVAREANGYVDDSKPWVLAKTAGEDSAKAEELAVVMGNLIKLCRVVGDMLKTIIPETAEKIAAQVGGDKVEMGEPLFPGVEG